MIVAGSLCWDFTHYLPQPTSDLDESPVLDSERAIGGKGYNQAVAVGRAGAHATLITAIGRDGFGHDLLRGAQAKTAVIPFNHAPNTTDMCSIIVAPNGDRQIYPTWESSNEIPRGWMLTQLSYFEDKPVSEMLLSFSLAPVAIAEAANWARQHKIPLTVNAAPRALIQPDVVAMADTVIGRSDELDGLTRQPGQTWITTLGADGLTVTTDRDQRDVAAVSVNAVDTTGAGDCFAGWLTGARAATASLHAAIEVAMTAAALSVTRRGAAKSFPTLDEVEHFQAIRS